MQAHVTQTVTHAHKWPTDRPQMHTKGRPADHKCTQKENDRPTYMHTQGRPTDTHAHTQGRQIDTHAHTGQVD